MKVLVLNSDYTPLTLCSWQDAMHAWLGRGIVTPLEPSSKFIRSGSQEWNVPSVIVLKKRDKSKKNNSLKFHRKVVLERDEYRCQYCEVKFKPDMLTIDHVIPISRWGSGNPTTYTNTVAACHPCNGRKANKTPAEAKMKLMKEPKNVTAREAFINKLKLNNIRKEWITYLQGHITFPS